MCGIAGIISLNKLVIQPRTLSRMALALSHRGPDGEGFYISTENNVGLAHTRLAIIDLSAAAAQPMHYLNRYSIVYNGEIYNYKILKATLQKQGYLFTTNSDTEVILAAYDFYKEDCITYFDGMFSFAIWDSKDETLFCARDTFGEKPFYYCIDDDVFLFASEMKALWAIGVDKLVDEKMMLNYLALGIVQNANDKSQTFYKNILALPPAHYGVLHLATMKFDVIRFSNISKDDVLDITESQAIEKLNNLLETSIINRLQSDVALGTSLSGGLDSSTIAYYINMHKENHFKTFSATFQGFEKDESALINELCNLYNISNHKVSPLASGLVADFEKMCYHQEEPIASSSIYAQYKVYELANTHNVKVVLDGQGADEILAGYTKYLHWYLQELICNNKYKKAIHTFKQFKNNNLQIPFGIKNIAAGYLPAHASFIQEKKAIKTIANNKYLNPQFIQAQKGNDWLGITKPTITKLNDILYYNTMDYGLEELLRYADRNSMAHGVEVRLPFLNIELVSFIFSLPPHLKISKGFTKYILRKLMENNLPKAIVWNPIKTGFETPQKNWMEDKKVQQLIQDAKQTLVNKHILMPHVLNINIKPQHVHEAGNEDWRYLSLAAIL